MLNRRRSSVAAATNVAQPPTISEHEVMWPRECGTGQSAQTWPTVLGALATVTPDNDAAIAPNCAVPTISTASAVRSTAAPAASSPNDAVIANYAPTAARSPATVRFHRVISLAKEIFRCSQPFKKGPWNGMNDSISCSVIVARFLRVTAFEIGSGDIERK